MSARLAYALAVAAISGAAIVWQVQQPDERQAPLTARPPVPSVQQDATADEPADVLQGWVNTALERPLFREDRRPVRAPNENVRAASGQLRLTGVLTGPFGNRAIFLSPDNSKPMVVQEKGQLNGLTVRSIEPGKVVVIKPDGNAQTLTPSFTGRE